MTVLRSREVKSVVEPVSKSNSPNSENLKQPRVSSIEPETPRNIGETQAADASNTATQMTGGSTVSGTVRRSSRLALKACGSGAERSQSVSRVSSRKKRSVKLSGGGSGKSEGRVEMENAVVEDSVDGDLVSKKGELGFEGESGVAVGDGMISEVSKGNGEGDLGGEVGCEEAVDGIIGEVSKGNGEGDLVGEVKCGEGVADGMIGEVSKGNDEGDLGGEVECGEAVVEGLGGDTASNEVVKKGNGKGKRKVGFEGVGEGEEDGRCLRLRSGKKVVMRGGVRGSVDNEELLETGTGGCNDVEEKGEGDCGGEGTGAPGDLESNLSERLNNEMMRNTDKGKGRLSRKDKGKGKLVDMVVEPEAREAGVLDSENVVVKEDGSSYSINNISSSESDEDDVMKEGGSQILKPRIGNHVLGIDAIADRYRAIVGKRNKGPEGEGIDAWDELISKCVDSMKAYLTMNEKVSPTQKHKGILNDELVGPSGVGRRRLSRQQKGKWIAPETVVKSGTRKVAFSDGGNAEMQDGIPEVQRAERSNGDTVPVQDGTQLQENDVGDHVARTRDRFRAQARRSASKFAYFSTVEEEQNNLAGVAETETTQREINVEMEDWPGPFSTAMKIIRERGTNVNLQQKKGKETSQVMWAPKQEKDRKSSDVSVPMLLELCLRTLTKNADALTSLDYVPDVLRHKLSHMLCDMRRMNSHFLELLVRGSPAEIRIRDCSWLSEEDFTKIFAGADINNLAVLQLDQCGRCMPDYILYSTLGRSPNCLPLLTTLSLKGACRLSDAGLNTLLSSAPALRSVNLSQCSLLTIDSMNSIADSLGSALRELYIDDCESIDPILMLPALSKLEHLEVLSLAGLHAVCDDFICQLIALRGHNLKELVLADCVNLTDLSLKIISKSCTGMRALDLSNLCKLTDIALGYLANGCQLIRTLKLRRNVFSDEALAAYLEISGASLEELSLNNVGKVAQNTAVSLAKCSKYLQHLDISFCRNLSDEAVGLVADSCLSLKTLKLFGCTQITNLFLDGHSNEQLQVIGLQLTPILENIKVPELVGPLRYSSVPSQ
ncbi:hypothetical protein ACET3Z_028257 [Daucus carota]